jgi:diacylglycerol diphosphate phosphatase/phosphatidate phosphatase
MGGHVVPPPTRRRLFLVLLVFAVSVGTSTLVTQVLKVTVGRMRPDFVARCLGLAIGETVPLVGWSEFRALVAAGCDASAAHRVVDEGLRSFPSGHASTAFSLATTSALLIVGTGVGGRMMRVVGPAVTGFVAGVPLILALLCAVSRVVDFRHFPSDVITGCAIGLFSAVLTHMAYFGLPHRGGEGRGWAAKAI